MKLVLFFLLAGLVAFAVGGCATYDDEPDPDDVVIGETTGGPHRVARDYRSRDDDVVYDREIASRDFDSLADYDYVLTDQERRILQERARERGDDADDYLEYLTENEKANLRERSETLIDDD